MKSRRAIEPVNLTWQEVALTYFAKSESWLRDHLDELAAKGFPRPDPDYGVFHRPAIDAWWAVRLGLPSPAATAQDAAERELIERARHGRRESAIPRHQG